MGLGSVGQLQVALVLRVEDAQEEVLPNARARAHAAHDPRRRGGRSAAHTRTHPRPAGESSAAHTQYIEGLQEEVLLRPAQALSGGPGEQSSTFLVVTQHGSRHSGGQGQASRQGSAEIST